MTNHEKQDKMLENLIGKFDLRGSKNIFVN